MSNVETGNCEKKEPFALTHSFKILFKDCRSL